MRHDPPRDAQSETPSARSPATRDATHGRAGYGRDDPGAGPGRNAAEGNGHAGPGGAAERPGPDEGGEGSAFTAYTRLPGRADATLLLLADHASNALPPGYPPALGLPEAEFERHIAYDIGVAGVTRGLAELLGAPALLSNFSRLLIDPNRGEDDPTLVMRLSDGAIVPANHALDRAERERRLETCWRPYDAAVRGTIDRMWRETGLPPLVVSIHSFTPFWKRHPRPWQVGVLWDADDRAARALIEALATDPDLVVGDNEPYDGGLGGDMMNRQAHARGLAHALIEIRQDLIGEATGQGEWVERLAPLLARLDALPDMHAVRHYPSRTL